MAKRIAGAGGGRQSAPAPQQNVNVQQTVVVQSAGPERSDDANSLFSKSSIRLIDVISEGEIEGLRHLTIQNSQSFLTIPRYKIRMDQTTLFIAISPLA
jgi:hypothetical protein